MSRGTFITALLALGGCTNELPPQRDCTARVWVAPDGGNPRVLGSWNGWAAPGAPAEPHESGFRLARFELPPGEHGYLLDTGDDIVLDPLQPLTTFDLDNDEREVSLLLVPDCAEPALVVNDVAHTDVSFEIHAQFLANRDASPLAGVSAVDSDGRDYAVTLLATDTGQVNVSGALEGPRRSLRITATSEDGASDTQRVVVWNTERDPRDEVLYQVMIDRFYGDDGAPLSAPVHAGARAGGTLDGVRARLDDVTALGATAVWLSPVYAGPDEERAGNDGRSYTGYHGYWPVDTRAVDARIGGETALDAMVDAAHTRALLVLADVVPNHVYETHPRASHSDWFHPAGCICGTVDCPWHAFIESCWFTPYLPDVRLEHPDALNAAVDDVAWLVERFDLDGVRVDAVPMMRRAATRRLAHRLRRDLSPSGRPLLLGEIFTGPGVGQLEQLRPFVGPSGLESVFDFPLMWAIHGAIATGTGGFDEVEALLVAEEETFAGSGVVLARILDNHDTPRFVSVAHGDADGDPWEPALQPTDAEPYNKMALAFALTFTLPGMPVIFQGDEIGMAGRNDPDCRRVMPAETELNEHQRGLRATVAALASLRAASPALRRGERTAMVVERTTYVFARTDSASGDHKLVVLNASPEPVMVDTEVTGGGRDVLSSENVSLGAVDVSPWGFRVIEPGG